MSTNEPKTEWIRLVASPTDKALLEAIAADNGDDSISATVRRLIRQEAKRRDLSVLPVDSTATPTGDAVDRATLPSKPGEVGRDQVGGKPASVDLVSAAGR